MQDPFQRLSDRTYTSSNQTPPTSCPNCGAGLPPPTFASDHHVTCDYCGSVVHFGRPPQPAPPPAPAPGPVWPQPAPYPVPDSPPANQGAPPIGMRIVLLLVSFFWAFPVGIIIGVVYLTRAEPGKKAFGKQVLMVVALHFIMSCVLVGFFSAFGTASGT